MSEQSTRRSQTPQKSPSSPRSGAWRTVALHELVVRTTRKSFLVGLVLTLVMIVGGIAVTSFLNDRGSSTTIAVASEAGQQYVERADERLQKAEPNSSYEAKNTDDVAAATTAVQEGTADLALVQDSGRWTVVTKTGTADASARLLIETVEQSLLQRAAQEQGVQLQQLQAESEVLIRGTEASSQAVAAKVLSFVFAVLFYLAAVIFGMAIAQSILEEKSNRVVEIVASAVPVRQLLVGKLVANILLAVGQLVLYIVAGMLAMNVFDLGLDFGWVLEGSGWFLVFFLTGFSILAAVWAVAGAMADRTEDLSATSAPLTTILIVFYVAGLFSSGTVKVVLSYVPLASSIIMPTRLVEGSAAQWEGLVSLGISVLALVLVMAWAVRVYRRAVMRTGGKIGWGQVLRGKL